MNKKYLSVVLFGALMLGAAGTFTGCIDNDEPAGIENLRGAKAELLKAKAAVEYALGAELGKTLEHTVLRHRGPFLLIRQQQLRHTQGEQAQEAKIDDNQGSAVFHSLLSS